MKYSVSLHYKRKPGKRCGNSVPTSLHPWFNRIRRCRSNAIPYCIKYVCLLCSLCLPSWMYTQSVGKMYVALINVYVQILAVKIKCDNKECM